MVGWVLASKLGLDLTMDGRAIPFSGSNALRRLELHKFDYSPKNFQISFKSPKIVPLSNGWSHRLMRDIFTKFTTYSEYIPLDQTIENIKDISELAISGKTIGGYFDGFQWADAAVALGFPMELKLKNRNHSIINAEIEFENYIGLHLRIGDYLNHGDIYPILSEEYYFSALELLNREKEFVIFCENAKEASNIFPQLTSKAKYILDDGQLSGPESLSSMTRCSDLIIANSSFSNWAAYFLSKSKAGQIICPKNFFHIESHDLRPQDWIRI